MNKKTLFLTLLGAVLISPFTAYAIEAGDIAKSLQGAALNVGLPIIVVGWIIAGILYLTSAGGSQMETGKKALMACVVGTILVILAAGACNFINGLFQLKGSC